MTATEGSTEGSTGTTESLSGSACDLEWAGLDPRNRRCVSVLEGSSARAHAIDLDADGRDELFVDDARSLNGAGLFSWTGYDVARQAVTTDTAGYYSQCWLRYDFDQDGVLDLNCLKTGSNTPHVWKNLGATLGNRIPQLTFDPSITTSGAALPFDPDQDGRPERMITVAWPPEIGGFRLYQEQGDELVTTGPAESLGGCAIPDGVAYADFDEDGSDDAVILDSPIGCNGYPTEYDPSWHRVHVFAAGPVATVELRASIPTGGIPKHTFGQIFTAEMTGDTHIDIAVELHPSEGIIAIIPGRGDGSFDPATVYSASDLGVPGDVRGLFMGQFDGDPWPEIAFVTYPDSTWVLDDPNSDFTPLEQLDIGDSLKAVGDFDGDGVDDLALTASAEQSELVILLSQP